MTAKTIAIIIVAAGSSSRMGGGTPKPYRTLHGRAVLRHSVDAFAALGEMIVAINPDHQGLFKQAAISAPWVAGGASRQESVRLALESLADNPPDYVLIHDAARPFVSKDVIDRVVAALVNHVAVVPAIAVIDSIRHIDGHAVTRDDVRAVQTPQGFHYDKILAAHRVAAGQSHSDDAAVMEVAGHTVFLVEGDVKNNKLTTQADWENAIHTRGHVMRIGQGFDVHRLIENATRPLMMCGVEIESALALDGHSDADVGLHALVDAMLGAIGAGDIGEHFPPSNATWKNANSADFVAHALVLMKEQGFSIGNADITIICERPKISQHRDAMRARVAQLLEVEPSQVNIKATTTEGLGFTGRGEGIAAQAVVMVSQG